MKVYLSAPRANDEQVGGVEKIQEGLSSIGLEILLPHEDFNERVNRIKECDAVLFWVDGLMPKGAAIVQISNATNQLEVGIPEEMQKLINIGMQATGVARINMTERRPILLPNETEKIENAPKSLSVTLPPGAYVMSVNRKLNVASPDVMFEAGYATCLRKPSVYLSIIGNEHFPLLSGDNCVSVNSIEDAVKSFERLKNGLPLLEEVKENESQ